jgi:hypothetical protein
VWWSASVLVCWCAGVLKLVDDGLKRTGAVYMYFSDGR